jgi:antitoxin HicB
MAAYKYTVLLAPAEEGGYTVTCPALPGVITEGDTYEIAMDRAREAIECHVESLLMDGETLPPDVVIPLEPRKALISGIVAEAVA